jgi:hypothetical protein
MLRSVNLGGMMNTERRESMTSLKTAAVGALIVAGIAIPLFVWQNRSLRGENDRLHRRIEQLSTSKAESDRRATSLTVIPRESWKHAGYADPESAFQTATWARSQGDVTTFLASTTPDGPAAGSIENKPENVAADDLARSLQRVTGYRLIDKEVVTEDEVIITVRLDNNLPFRLQRIEGQWKLDGPARRR